MRLVILALGFALGIVLAASAHFPLWVWPALAVPALLAAVTGGARLRWGALALLALALGGLRYANLPPASTLSAFNDVGGLTLTGVVDEPPELTDSALLLRVSAEQVERGGEITTVTGRALVHAPVSADVRAGDRIQATGRLVTARTTGDLDYGDYLARSGIGSLMRDTAVEVLGRDPAFWLQAALGDVRTALANAIHAALPPPQAGLLVAILLGDESGIAPDLADAFAVTGTAHLVAISGFNMLVVSSATHAILLGLGLSPRKSALLSVGVIALYTLLAGATPAVVRAALMSSLLVVGQSLRRKTFAPTSLAFAVLIIAALNPLALWDVGFQLSLTAAFGIALLAGPITRAADTAALRLPRPLRKPAQQWITPTVSTTLAAQVAVVPLIALVFGRVSLISPLVNLLVGPAQPALLLSGAAAALLGLVPMMPPIVFLPVFLLLSFTIAVVESFARLPWAEVTFYPGAAEVALFYVLFLAGGLLMAARPSWWLRLGQMVRSRPVALGALAAALILLLLTGARAANLSDQKLQVWFFDMDGENAALIRTPGGAMVLIDGGSHPARLLSEIGSRLPFDVRTLDLWVITQPSLARIASGPRLLDQFAVSQVLTNGQPSADPALEALLDRAGAVSALQAGQTIRFSDGVTLDVLHPQAIPAASASLPDHSLVLRLNYGEVHFLLSGDVSTAGQEALIEAGFGLPASVVQLPSGGSESGLSPDLLAVAQPQAVVIQNQSDNPAEPAPDTLLMLEGQQVFQSSGGTVHFTSDGARLWAVQGE